MTLFTPSSASDSFEESEADRPSSDRVLNLRRFKRISTYFAFYSGGLALAFLPRLIPSLWVPYTFIKASAIGYLMFFPPSTATTEGRALRRFCGLALAASFILGNWDGAWLSATVPVLLPFTSILMPLWVVAISSVVGAIALSALVFISWRMSNGTQRIAPFRESGNPFN
jgi:hypothetical protein